MRDLLSKLLQLLVSFLDFLVQGLVFDLELLEVDEMEAVSKLLTLLEYLLLVGEAVSQSDVLESVLMDLLIFERLAFFPLFEGFLGDLLASSREHSILCNGTLELLELRFDLTALCLLLVELGLELRGHLVVTILGFLQVDTDLMDVCQSVQVLVLVHLDIALALVVIVVLVHGQDLLLELVILALQVIAFLQLLLNGLDQIVTHLVLTWKLRDATFVTVVIAHVVRGTLADVLVATAIVLLVLGVLLTVCALARSL